MADLLSTYKLPRFGTEDEQQRVYLNKVLGNVRDVLGVAASGHGSTTTTTSITIPAVGSTVVVNVVDGGAFPTQAYCLPTDGANWFVGQVTAGGGTNSLTVKNIANGAGTTIASGAVLTFSGNRGPQGATGSPGTNASAYIGTTTNTGNTYTSASPPTYTTGVLYVAQFNAANTGAATLDSKSIYKNGAALTGGEIAANAMIALLYDGTQFNMTGDGRGSGGGTGWTLVASWTYGGSPAAFLAASLSGYSECRVVCSRVTKSASSWLVAAVSADGGSTYPSVGAFYIDPNGVENSDGNGMFYLHSTASSAARSCNSTIYLKQNSSSGTISALTPSRTPQSTLLYGLGGDVNYIKVMALSGNLTGGTVEIFAR